MPRLLSWRAWICLSLAFVALGCGEKPKAAPTPPNVLWIVWDTARADRMSLYGYAKPTTPFLEEWAREARVFGDSTSPAPWTVPAHASLFTGLLPSEHGANGTHLVLEEAFVTSAELFRDAGYQTYLFSANPHVSHIRNLGQGFDTQEHPWDDRHREQALRIVRDKIHPDDRSSELPQTIRSGRVRGWDVKASGELAQQALRAWLDQRDAGRPYFAFLNYMESHRPYIPPERYRLQVANPEQVRRSYQVDRSLGRMWAYSFGLVDYTGEELAVISATYDASLAELDDLFRELISDLEEHGDLENTIVVLTSDHGEHLGEHHLLDHQFSLHEELVRVPLILHAPGLEPGREDRPVMSYDLFPTLLELAGVEPPADLRISARSLATPGARREQVAEYYGGRESLLAAWEKRRPDHDFSRFKRALRMLRHGASKFIWASDGSHALYDLADDPREDHDRFGDEPEQSARMLAQLEGIVAEMQPFRSSGQSAPELSPEMRGRLRALGYADDSD